MKDDLLAVLTIACLAGSIIALVGEIVCLCTMPTSQEQANQIIQANAVVVTSANQ